MFIENYNQKLYGCYNINYNYYYYYYCSKLLWQILSFKLLNVDKLQQFVVHGEISSKKKKYIQNQETFLSLQINCCRTKKNIEIWMSMPWKTYYCLHALTTRTSNILLYFIRKAVVKTNSASFKFMAIHISTEYIIHIIWTCINSYKLYVKININIV